MPRRPLQTSANPRLGPPIGELGDIIVPEGRRWPEGALQLGRVHPPSPSHRPPAPERVGAHDRWGNFLVIPRDNWHLWRRVSRYEQLTAPWYIVEVAPGSEQIPDPPLLGWTQGEWSFDGRLVVRFDAEQRERVFDYINGWFGQEADGVAHEIARELAGGRFAWVEPPDNETVVIEPDAGAMFDDEQRRYWLPSLWRRLASQRPMVLRDLSDVLHYSRSRRYLTTPSGMTFPAWTVAPAQLNWIPVKEALQMHAEEAAWEAQHGAGMGLGHHGGLYPPLPEDEEGAPDWDADGYWIGPGDPPAGAHYRGDEE